MKGWRPLARIARRTLSRNRSRSLLIIAMIALPAMVATFVLVTYQTGDVTGEKIWRAGHGQADLVASYDSTASQDNGERSTPAQVPSTLRESDRVTLLSMLPAGSQVATLRSIPATLSLASEDRTSEVNHSYEGDLDDPVSDGVLALSEGRAPLARNEIAIGESNLAALGIGLGDTVGVSATTRESSGDLGRTERSEAVVVGTIDTPFTYRSGGLYLQSLPGPINVQQIEAASPYAGVSLDVKLPEGTSARDVFSGIDSEGGPLTVFEPMVAAHWTDGSIFTLARDYVLYEGAIPALILLATTLGLVSVALVITAAFAVGARRGQRDLALIAVTGASRRQLSAIAAFQGLLLGVFGAGIGLIAGLLIFIAARIPLQDLMRVRLDGTPVLGWRVLVALACCVLVSVVAAWVAARKVSVDDPLRQSWTSSRAAATRPRFPRLALTVVVVGILGAVLTGGRYSEPLSIPVVGQVSESLTYASMVSSQLVLAVFFMMIVFGVVGALPALLAYVGRHANRRPLIQRLALRDAARARYRTVPTVVMIMAVTTLSLAALIVAVGIDGNRELAHTPDTPAGVVGTRVDLGEEDRRIEASRALAADQLSSTLGTAEVYDVKITGSEAVGECDPNPDAGMCWTAPIYVADAGLIAAMALEGTDEAAIREHLVNGGLINFARPDRNTRSNFRPNNIAQEIVVSDDGFLSAFANSRDPRTAPHVDLPVLTLEPKQHSTLQKMVFASEATAKVLPSARFKPDESRTDHWVFVRVDEGAAKGQIDGARAALSAHGFVLASYSEFVPLSGGVSVALTASAVLLVLMTMGIGGALAATEQRDDQRLLRSIGATPQTLRRITWLQGSGLALVGIGLGAAIGVAFGSKALTALPYDYPTSIPLPQLAVLVLAAPLIAWAVAARTIPNR